MERLTNAMIIIIGTCLTIIVGTYTVKLVMSAFGSSICP